MANFSGPLRSECKLILYLPTIHIYCVRPAMSKSPIQVPNCLKITETSVVIIVFNAGLCEVRAFTVTVSFCRST